MVRVHEQAWEGKCRSTSTSTQFLQVMKQLTSKIIFLKLLTEAWVIPWIYKVSDPFEKP